MQDHSLVSIIHDIFRYFQNADYLVGIVWALLDIHLFSLSWCMAGGGVGCHSRLLVQRDLIKCIYKPQGAVLTAKQEEELSPFLFYPP